MYFWCFWLSIPSHVSSCVQEHFPARIHISGKVTSIFHMFLSTHLSFAIENQMRRPVSRPTR